MRAVVRPSSRLVGSRLLRIIIQVVAGTHDVDGNGKPLVVNEAAVESKDAHEQDEVPDLTEGRHAATLHLVTEHSHQDAD